MQTNSYVIKPALGWTLKTSWRAFLLPDRWQGQQRDNLHSQPNVLYCLRITGKVVAYMGFGLGIMAGIIFFAYSLYFTRIIKGNHEVFEMDLLQVLGNWMIEKGMSSRRIMWAILVVSVFIEVTYFGLALLLIDNLAMQFITGLVVGVESFHLAYMIRSFARFFGGKIVLKQLFSWRLERASAMLLFTHSFLVLVFLLAY